MLGYIKELISFHELLFTWTRRDFNVRYSQSILGAAWAVLQPFSLMIIFSLVFSMFIRVPTEGIPYPIFVYTALLPWTFFTNSLSFAIPSLVNNMSLVDKIYFPREILPLSAILVCFIDFLIAGIIFLLMIFFYKIQLHWIMLFYPLVIFLQIILTLGISLSASALMVKFRDMRFVIPLALQIWMYASPIIYPATLIPEKFEWLYFLNPMAAIIDTYRRVILLNLPPDWAKLGIAALISIFIFIISYHFFKNKEKEFADII